MQDIVRFSGKWKSMKMGVGRDNADNVGRWGGGRLVERLKGLVFGLYLKFNKIGTSWVV